MRFFDLLNKYTNEQIINALNNNFNTVESDCYLITLNELRQLKPSQNKQDAKIKVEYIKDKEDNYYVCHGIGPDENGKIMTWILEYEDWNEWLAKEIDEDSLRYYDETFILSHILWEMTFNGYTQQDVTNAREELKRRIDKLENHPEDCISHEETMDELDKNNGL